MQVVQSFKDGFHGFFLERERQLVYVHERSRELYGVFKGRCLYGDRSGLEFRLQVWLHVWEDCTQI